MCRSLTLALLLASSLVVTAADWTWDLPKGFPPPTVPVDNPMIAVKVELGRYLFYDKRLSVNGKQACASCHRQELAFTDGLPQAQGATGQYHPRSSMSLANVAYLPTLTWANPALTALENQALIPMFSDTPIELGLKGHEAELLALLGREPVYQKLFPLAFPNESNPLTLANLTKSIAAFERSIVSLRSPYDRYRWGGEPSALSDSAKRGEILFFSGEHGGCFRCHGTWTFAGDDQFFNTGVSPTDPTKFRVPSLRNVAITAPYMHDGSLRTLEDVLDHYAAGGKFPNPNKTSILHPLSLTPADKHDLIEFLKSLTDESLLHDPRWTNPWPSR